MKSTLKRLICIIACMALVMAFSTNAMAAGKIKDGNYNIGFAFAGGSGKATVTSCTLIVSGGKMQVKFTIDSTYYTKVEAGGTVYKNQSPGSNSTFTIPVSALDTAIPFNGTTTKMQNEHTIAYTLTLKSSTLPASAFEEEKPAQQPEQPKKTQSSQAQSEAQSSSVEESSTEASSTEASSTAASSSAAAVTTVGESNGGGGVNAGVIIAVVVVVVAIAGGAGYYFVNKKKKGN